MEAGNAELEFDAVKVSEANPFKQVARIWEPAINLPFRVLREYSYSLGWCRTQLPGPMALPNNEADRSQLPTIGKGTPSRLVIYYEGAISGIVSFSALFPETNSTAIVLSNSTPLNYDGPRFIAELLIETMIGGTESTIQSIITRSKQSADEMRAFVDGLIDQISKTQTHPEPVRKLDEYVGRYYNAIDTFFFNVINANGELRIRFYGVEEEEFTLHPYQEDSFTWLPTHDESPRKGRYYDYPMEYYIIQFGADDSKSSPIATLSWRFDFAVDEPEVMRRKGQAQAQGDAQQVVVGK